MPSFEKENWEAGLIQERTQTNDAEINFLSWLCWLLFIFVVVFSLIGNKLFGRLFFKKNKHFGSIRFETILPSLRKRDGKFNPESKQRNNAK